MVRVELIVLLFCIAVLGEVKSLDVLNVDEKVNPRFGIGKEKCYGIFMGNSVSKVDVDSIFVRIPKIQISKLSVRVISIDGTYSAKINYKIPDKFTDSIYNLSYPLTNSGYLSKYLVSELAVLASVATNDQYLYDSLLIIQWGSLQSETINILYSAGDDEITYMKCPAKKICQTIKSNKKIIYFNRRCTFSNSVKNRLNAKINSYECGRKVDNLTIWILQR